MSHKIRPALKQFYELTERDFEAHPVWVSVHTTDYDEPWYDESDEETFRPWLGELPMSKWTMQLVRCECRFVDGTTFPGFLTPQPDHRNAAEDLGTMQPHLWLASGAAVGFWEGVIRDEEARANFYNEVGRAPETIFPIRCVANRGLTRGHDSCEVAGFHVLQDETPAVEW
jgi:hypothetical protein